MKFKIIFTILVVILAVISVFLFKNKDILQNDKPIIEPVVINIKEEKITDNTKPFKINIVYPQIDGFDDFNKKVKNIIDKELNNFKISSLENDKAIKETDPINYENYPREYDLNIGYEKGLINENIVSVIFNVYNFIGGAHGANYFISLNYNLKTKQEINLADLFPGQTGYLQKISDFCIKDLTKQLTDSGGIEMTDASWIERGAGPNEENFQFFLINKDNLIFYFPRYQIAAGAAGDFKVIFPR